jgi:hypothetical protein
MLTACTDVRQPQRTIAGKPGRQVNHLAGTNGGLIR